MTDAPLAADRPADRPTDRLMRPVRWLGFVEGVSFMALLLVAMPLKYGFGRPWAVEHIGMAHGVLFIGLVAGLVLLCAGGSLTLRRALLGVAASVLPLGPWLLDHRVYPARSEDPSG